MKQQPDVANRLSVDFRSALRFFAFFVANGSLFAGKPWEAYDLDYIPALLRKDGPSIKVVPKFEDWELGITGSGLGWKDCVNEFCMMLGDGKLEPELLGDVNYAPELFGCGSTLEQVYAVFSNVIEIDGQGAVSNKAQAFHRAAQCVKEWCGVGYKVDPPYKGWEVELH